MKPVARIDERIKQHIKKIKDLRERMLNIFKRSYLVCTQCGKRSRLEEWEFIRFVYLEPDFGSNGGNKHCCTDTVYSSVICPRCRKSAKVATHLNKEVILLAVDKECLPLKALFAKIWEGSDTQNVRQIYPRTRRQRRVNLYRRK